MNTMLFLALASAAAAAPAPDGAYLPYLDTASVGASAWIQAHPAWDGRGVAVAVLDSGVDMGVPGLDRLPDGNPKVIEARDFTGESVVECERPMTEKGEDGKPIWRRGDFWVRGLDAVDGGRAAEDGWLGYLDESRFRATSVPDLNGNGRTDDRFAVVVYRDAKGEWTALVDRDGDRDLAGETPQHAYSKDMQPLRLAGYDPARGVSPLSIALHIEASENGPRRVEFHVPGGPHGTHVAGIAAGSRLYGNEGFDGIAPGANVLSLKIGDNSLAGGATVSESMRRALEFAGRWARRTGTPLVVNISYGIGSEVEGRSSTDQVVQRFCEENPTVVVVTSAGNQGPGLSTVGSPAASQHAVSVAAAYSPATARELLGAEVTGPRLFQFSARGGEVGKPDVAAPGIASSTVPAYARSDVMRGTSMASPQVAGVAALVLSAMRAEHKDAAWNSGMMKRALVRGARPMAGYGPLDAGAGMVDVAGTHAAFAKEVGNGRNVDVLGLEVTVPVPTLAGGKGGAAYWRAGGWAPGEDRPATVSVRPRFVASASGDAKERFYRTLTLKADAGWVRLSRSSLALRGDRDATFDLWVDSAAVRRPGVHVATVTGADSSGLTFTFPVTVVVPEPAVPVRGVPSVLLPAVRLGAGDLLRVPLAPPPGTGTMAVSARTTKDRKASAYVYLHDPQGRRLPVSGGNQVSSELGTEVSATLSTRDLLDPGTIELVLYCVPTARSGCSVDVEVRFPGLDADPVTTLRAEQGQAPRGRMDVTNSLAVPFVGKARGLVAGFERTLVRRFSQTLKETIRLSPEFDAVEVELLLSPEDYARYSDIAINILDRDGKVVARDGFSTRQGRVVLRNLDPSRAEAEYTLEVKAGRALREGGDSEVRMAIRHLLRDTVELTASVGGQQHFELPPTLRTSVELRAAATPKSPPDGSTWFGSVVFVSDHDKTTWLSVPIRARPSGRQP